MSHQDHSEIEVPLDPRPYVRLGLIVLGVTFGILLLWAAIAPLSSAVVASGRVVVASENKVVQHLDGGLVKKIAVEDGEIVKAGQLLLALDDQALRIRLGQVQEQLIEVRANLERLSAERDGRDVLRFSDALLRLTEQGVGTDFLKTQRQLFTSRRSALSSEHSMLLQRRLQTRKQLDGGEKLLVTLGKRLALMEEEQRAQLAVRDVVAGSKMRETEGQLVALQGEMVAKESEMARLRETLAEIDFNISLKDQEYQKEVVTQMRDLQTQQITLQAEKGEISDKLGRIEIRAPVTGKVKGLNVVTLGAVITAGKSIMEIVPQAQKFKIHARISPMDIDSIYPGLHAEIKLNVFDGSRHFPSLYADLVDVSTDVYEDEAAKESYYKASLTIDEKTLQLLKEKNLQVISGMPVDVVIKTGKRTLLDYLMKPLQDMVVRAFNEA